MKLMRTDVLLYYLAKVSDLCNLIAGIAVLA